MTTAALTAETTETPERTPAAARAVSGPRVVLGLEGLAVLAAATAAYVAAGGGWGLYAALFLVPDLGMLAYLAGPRLGAIGYGLTHNYVLPLGLVAAGHAVGAPTLLLAGLVWVAHIGFDRLLGYGIKYGSGFRDTHLQRV
ncbi:MAG TPA: DUF4260 domain-containing protein [Sandaracinaceae bacterium LLY-WYZ-13_1]|nr:DUF4260 domain-containing protein [Sandaracinaceae bacterium LLY-WYZ-13_1]